MVEWKKLGEVCQVLNGFAFKSSEYVTEGIRIIRISDVQNGYISDKDRVYYPIEKLSEYERYLLNNGDLVMSLTGNPGRVAFIRKESCALNQRVACLRAKTISNSYLFYLFNCKEFESTAFANSTGGAQKNLSTTWLNNFPIPIPSLSEQQRIVGILDTFTSAIDNLKEQIAQRRKQYEYYRDELLDLEGKPGVEMKTLGEVCGIKGRIGFRGYTREDQVEEGEGVISLSPGNIENGQMVYKGCTYITWEKYEESPEIKTFNGDILFCKTGSTVGKVAMVKELPCEATINPQLVVLKNITIDSKFLNYILATYTIQSTVKRLAGVGSVPNISQEKLSNLQFPLPPLHEQQRIVSILDTFEASIQNLEAQLKQREKQYEYYRNKLLTFE